MNIQDIKDFQLRKLAELRRKQYEERNGFVKLERVYDLSKAFFWMDTKEEYTFWDMVNEGEITSIPPSMKNEDENKPKPDDCYTKWGEYFLSNNDQNKAFWLFCYHMREQDKSLSLVEVMDDWNECYMNYFT